jgi:hypothetical protein
VRPAVSQPEARGRNPQQIGNAFAHRPEVRDLGWWMYQQRVRIRAHWNRAVLRAHAKKQALRGD